MKSYKEHIQHGDSSFPFDLFHQHFPTVGMQCCRIHWHDESEWIYVYQGCISVFIDAVEYIVKENCLLCIPPKVLHYIICREDVRYITCIFRLEMLDFKQNDSSERDYITPILEQQIWFTMPIAFHDDKVKYCYFEIDEDFQEAYTGYELAIKANLYKIIAYANRMHVFVEHNKLKTHKLEPIEKVFHYIELHYDEKIKVETLAAMINYNTQYFTRYFKQHTGETPIEYVTRIRLEKALEMLMDTDKSVLDISLDCGFESCSYFIKRFTKFKKQTPHSYRNTLKEHKILDHEKL